jgi:hypothetical protein
MFRWTILSIFTVLIAGCGGGNGGNATSRSQPAFSGTLLTIAESSLPAARSGQAYNQLLSASGGTAPYTWSIASGTLPVGLALSSAGVISGIPVSVGAYPVTFKVVDSSWPQGEARLSLTITVNGNSVPLAILTTSLPAVTAGTAYNQTMTAYGGQAPYTWSIVAGTLPTGIVLSGDGVISGNPVSAGTSTVTFRAVDSGAPQSEAEQTLTITVTTVGGPLIVLTTSLPPVTAGTPYSHTLTASGGVPPYAWSIMSGSLPPGLTLSAAGVIAGTPTTAGDYFILFMVTDKSPAQPMVHQLLSITVN